MAGEPVIVFSKARFQRRRHNEFGKIFTKKSRSAFRVRVNGYIVLEQRKQTRNSATDRPYDQKPWTTPSHAYASRTVARGASLDWASVVVVIHYENGRFGRFFFTIKIHLVQERHVNKVLRVQWGVYEKNTKGSRPSIWWQKKFNTGKIYTVTCTRKKSLKPKIELNPTVICHLDTAYTIKYKIYFTVFYRITLHNHIHVQPIVGFDSAIEWIEQCNSARPMRERVLKNVALIGHRICT